jgi:sugar transferase EpsL
MRGPVPWEKFPNRRRLALSVKRAEDLIAASAGLVVLSPALFAITVAVLYFHGWPPIFAQPRPGLRGHVFTLYKFRTMTRARDAEGVLLPDRDRLTAFGAWLRSTSLDELPELFNVLKGDMSLVGPRPLLVEYLGRYSTEQMKRHEMRPGLTGWAQIHGRNACNWQEKLRHDVWYVENWSLGLDLRILVRTVWMVLKREGISAEGEATTRSFQGES